MLGHNHISDDHEAVAAADLLEYSKKKIAARFGGEQGTLLITTEGDEMQGTGAVVSLEAVGHILMLGSTRPEVSDP